MGTLLNNIIEDIEQEDINITTNKKGKKKEDYRILIADTESNTFPRISDKDNPYIIDLLWQWKTYQLPKLLKSKRYKTLTREEKREARHKVFTTFRIHYIKNNFKTHIYAMSALEYSHEDYKHIMQLKDNKDRLFWAEKLEDNCIVFEGDNILDRFIDSIEEDTLVYFHNMSKWDGHFILEHVIKTGYTDITNLNGEELKKINKEFSWHRHKGLVKYMLDGNNKIYSIELKRWIVDSFGSRFINIIIECSWLKFPTSVKKIGKELGLNKLDYDYNKYREEGQKLTDIEIDYIKRDTLIGGAICYSFISVVGVKGRTLAGQALRMWKDLRFTCVAELEKEYDITRLNTTIDSGKHKQQDIENLYKYYYPTIDKWGNIDSSHIELAYMGGISQVNEKYKHTLFTTKRELAKDTLKINPKLNVIHKMVRAIDIKSSYPNSMYRYNMPYGKPTKMSVDDWNKCYFRYQFAVFKVHIKSAVIKKSLLDKVDYIPFIPEVNSLGSYTYPKNIEDKVLYLCHLDLDNMLDYYHIEYDIQEVYAYKTMGNIFNTYIEKCFTMKEQTTGAIQIYWKTLLNALYGKFASKLFRENKQIKWNDNKGEFEYITQGTLTTGIYTPLSACITMHSRNNLVSVINRQPHRFIYCDTDSIYLIGTEQPLFADLALNSGDITDLGKWGSDGILDVFIACRSKVYLKHQFKDKKDRLCKNYVINKNTGKLDIVNNWNITWAGCPNGKQKDPSYILKLFASNKTFTIANGKRINIALKHGGKVIEDCNYTYNFKTDIVLDKVDLVVTENILDLDKTIDSEIEIEIEEMGGYY